VGKRDARATEAARELEVAVRRHIAVKAHLRAIKPGSAEWLRTRIQLDDLRVCIRELGQTMRERPWTEA
jgi:hypothetical protein